MCIKNCLNMEFIEGNIVRIQMRDFLTFDDMKVEPKPHLNVIIGPNGTGKSSIMCALALALCQKPAITGRGKEVADYVKIGKENATVEIEIYRNSKKNLVIKRDFSKANYSQFYVHGQKASFKDVEKELKKLHIQLDNLCQYLPQDRVVEFAKMNHIQLLEATEKTVASTRSLADAATVANLNLAPQFGGYSLYEQHENVRSSGTSVQNIRTKIKEVQTQYETEKSKNSCIEDQVQNHEVKKTLEANILDLKTRLLWFSYNEKRVQNIEYKKKQSRVKAEFDSIKEQIRPQVDKIKSFQDENEDVKKRLKIEEKLIANMTSNVETSLMNMSEFDEQRHDIIREYQNKENKYKQHQLNLKNLRKQLSTIENEVEQLKENEVDNTLLQEKIKILTSELRRLTEQQDEVQKEVYSSEEKHTNLQRSLRQLNDHIGRMQNTQRRRMQLLQQRHNKVFQASLWLETNAHRFKDTVYPPICTQINVRDPNHAQFVEDRISRADLIAFVCKNKDDVNTFKHLMDEQNLAVNIIHSGNEDLSVFRPSKPLHFIQKLGFDMYLGDAIEGPPAILHFLYKSYQLHNIPLALRDNVQVDRVPSDFSRFYISDTRYHRNKSRYCAEVITNLSSVHKPTLLTVTEQTDQMNNLKQQHQNITYEVANCEDRLRAQSQQVSDLSQAIEEKRKQKQEMTNQLSHRKHLLEKLQMKKNQISRIETDDVDLEAAETHMHSRLQATTTHNLEMLKKHAELKKKETTAQESLVKLRSLFKCLSEAVTRLTTANQEMEERLKAKEVELAAASAKVLESRRDGRHTLDSLLKILNLDSAEQISSAIRSKFAAGTQGVEATEAALNEKRAHLDCLTAADSQVVEEFHKRKVVIERLGKQLEGLRQKEANSVDSMAELRADWLKKVATLTSTINGSFSKLMARMKCAGEIKLSKPENEDDLGKYGLSICVKFRGNEKLRELTAQQQSGGERAVSTALYLLALQTLSAVPFRCADEINQGMDAENERQMFSMLVEHMTEQNASQYFLVTPKLLPNLPYNERVNFICIYNGPKISTGIITKDILKLKGKLNQKKKMAKR